MPAAASASQSASVPEEQPMAWATPSCSGGGLLKARNLLAKDELLRIQTAVERLQQFLAQRLVLPLQIQHRNGMLAAVPACFSVPFNGWFTCQCYQWDDSDVRRDCASRRGPARFGTVLRAAS